ncbi:hypothetical protein B0O99DRAFT_512434 [Bisporella sp. PMI_857]|nr:hypothetical protein B0O99DRAFT_512434 [Bisporella sp. PMI_857]
MADYTDLPDFDSLPKVPEMPQGCAWGVFDKDGKKDHLGCINLLTPTVIKEAYKEARDGVSISLNWPMGAIHNPGFQRKPLVHTVISAEGPPLHTHGFDDEVEFNTQCSSQWDGLVHFAYQKTGHMYNGIKTTVEELTQPFGENDADKALPTLNHWHDRGCLVGRGVLLDFRAYADAHGIKYNCFDHYSITVKDLEATAEYQGTSFKHGDVLIVRTGYTEELGSASAEAQAKMLGTHKAVGLEGSIDTARWIWNHHFAAVASDSLAFEVIPPIRPDGSLAPTNELVLHSYLISLFGMSIGELWDLKALGEHCMKTKRYEFLFTSSPLNISGSVASPPNALALF